jgi:hypothetical protein
VSGHLLRDPELDAALRRDGFVVVDGFVPAEGVAALSSTWDGLTDAVTGLPFSVTILSHDPDYRRRVNREVGRVFGGPARELLCDMRLVYGAFVAKQPGPGGAVPVHQDTSFVDETRHHAVNLWVPLVDVTPVNGCLRVIRGSHLLSDAPRGTDFRVPYLDAIRDDDFEAVPMRAGDVCVLDQAVYHCSPPNLSDKARIAAAALAVTADAPLRYYHGKPGAERDLEVFEVPDEFYCHHVLGTWPEGVTRIGRASRDHPALTAEQVRERLATPGA